MAWWVKDLVLLQLRCSLQLHLRFDPRPRNFHMLQVQPKKKKKKKKKVTLIDTIYRMPFLCQACSYRILTITLYLQLTAKETDRLNNLPKAT